MTDHDALLLTAMAEAGSQYSRRSTAAREAGNYERALYYVKKQHKKAHEMMDHLGSLDVCDQRVASTFAKIHGIHAKCVWLEFAYQEILNHPDYMNRSDGEATTGS